MTDATRQAIIEHAGREFPREACGLIINARGHERYFACRNLAENQRDFIMDPADYARAEDAGEVMAVVHSHPNAPARPSQADRVACEASGLPWVIYALPAGTWAGLTPAGYRAPLVGRQFVHGILDCYSLVRDWYREERGVELPDFDRREEWWKKGDDLYMKNFSSAGFAPIPADAPLARGDVILMQLQAKVANHAAIYLGRDQILHHVMKRLSCREIYGGFWKKVTRLVVRFQGSPA